MKTGTPPITSRRASANLPGDHPDATSDDPANHGAECRTRHSAKLPGAGRTIVSSALPDAEVHVMSKKLGICVTSNQHLPQLIELCRAACRKELEVDIFFTHLGCSMMAEPRFGELAEVTHRMALCMVCFQEHQGEMPVPGLGEKDYASQERHCELIDECDRYLNF